MNLAVVLGFGLLLGMQHATEADHLAAVASLAGRERSLKSGMIHGMAWGLGHTLTLMLAAVAVGLFGLAISPALGGHLEQAVGFMLVVLGVGVLRRLWRERIHFHAHSHADGAAHFHMHSHADEQVPHALSSHGHSHGLPWRSLLVGMMHGLAGSAALVLLAGQAMPTVGWMLIYVAVFGFGSLLGMALLSGALAIPLGLTAHRLTSAYRAINVAVGLFSIGLGIYKLFELGAH
jgi:high-affinity nickel permease